MAYNGVPRGRASDRPRNEIASTGAAAALPQHLTRALTGNLTRVSYG